MKRITLLLFAILVTCCGTASMVSNTKELVIKEHKEIVPVVLDYDIPLIVETHRVSDSTSHLENAFAVSDASVAKDGTLTHSLATKPQKLIRDTTIVIEYRDSLVREEKIIDNTKPLTRWQTFRLDGFWVLSAILGIIIALMVIKKV